MKKAGHIAVILVLAGGVCFAEEPPPAEPGFVEFVESEIIPMMADTGQVPAVVSTPWSEPAPADPASTPAGEAGTGEPEPVPARRDPFWPVGYVPPPLVRSSDAAAAAATAAGEDAVSAVLQWDEALKTVSVQGIMKTGPDTYVAMVNGQVIGVGDTVSVRLGGRDYRWIVAAVGTEGVSFKRVEEEVPASDESEPRP